MATFISHRTIDGMGSNYRDASWGAIRMACPVARDVDRGDFGLLAVRQGQAAEIRRAWSQWMGVDAPGLPDGPLGPKLRVWDLLETLGLPNNGAWLDPRARVKRDREWGLKWEVEFASFDGFGHVLVSRHQIHFMIRMSQTGSTFLVGEFWHQPVMELAHREPVDSAYEDDGASDSWGLIGVARCVTLIDVAHGLVCGPDLPAVGVDYTEDGLASLMEVEVSVSTSGNVELDEY